MMYDDSDNHNREHRKPQWTEAFCVRSPDVAGVEVLVMMSDHKPFPRYSVKVGRRVEDGRVLPFFGVRVEGQRLGRADFDAVFESIHGMLDEARELIARDAKRRADDWLDGRIERDDRIVNRGQPQTRHTGKTERTRERRSRRDI